MRQFDRAVLHHGMRQMDGLIVLTKRLAQDLAPGIPWLLMEGIAPNHNNKDSYFSPLSSQFKGVNKDFIIMYAGGLNEMYGIQLLVDVFSLLQEPGFILWLFGKGDMVNKIKIAANNDQRIKYWGFLPNNKVMEKARNATVLINPRPTNQDFTAYSFPSKTLEYMVTGRPVITTRLLGIPDEYFKYLFMINEETPEALAKLILDIRNLGTKRLNEFGIEAKKFVEHEKNYLKQGKRIINFIQSL